MAINCRRTKDLACQFNFSLNIDCCFCNWTCAGVSPSCLMDSSVSIVMAHGSRVAMGGMLNPFTPLTAHIHHFYFRIDLDIDGFQSDVCEEFNHNSLNDPGGDEWILLNSQSKRIAKSDAARKWRIRDLVSTNEAGQPRAYDIEIPQLAGRDNYSTGDVWVTIYRGDSIQQGADVGADCTDSALETVYTVGPLDTANGSDIVLWVVMRAHHVPRHQGEEQYYLPYHYGEFSIVPSNFAKLTSQTRG